MTDAPDIPAIARRIKAAQDAVGTLAPFTAQPGGLDIASAYEPVKPHLAIDLRFEHATQLILDGRYPDAVASLCSAAKRAEACEDSDYFNEQMRRFAALHNRKTTLLKLFRLNANALGLTGAQLT